MTSALEIGGGFLFMATLLIAVMFLAAFQLGRLVTRDDEQREVEVGRARTGSSIRPTSGATSGGGRRRRASSPGSTRRSRTLTTAR